MYLDIFHAPVGSQPLCDQRTVFIRPVVVKFFFAQVWVTFCADCDADELV
jgi:hypothetical protein